MDKLAILGGGPSAFYVASRLLSRVPADRSRKLIVHMYDRLWAPHGLVRYGVAPDHPEVKNCVHKFDELAKDSRFRYFGNVEVGTASGLPIPHAVRLPFSELQRGYTHLILASGCALPNVHHALSPSERVVPALDVVHWYTQHPTRPEPPPLDKAAHVTVIGQGNVALDVARMFLTSPDVLGKYDVPASVLDVFRRSAVRHVSIVGRRGPLQAAFTTKEVRELMTIPDVSMAPLDPTLLAPPSGVTLSRPQGRLFDLLRKGSTAPFGTTSKTWSLDFFRSPTGLLHPSNDVTLKLGLVHTSLDANARAIATGETSVMSTDLIVTALGQRLDPATPFYDDATRQVPVDATGRVLHPSGRPFRDVYASGWAAMGARGVLASTMMNAYNVADNLAQRLFEAEESSVPSDVDAERVMRTDVLPDDVTPPELVQAELKNGNVVTYEDWKLVDAEEVRRGVEQGKERERMDWADARAFLRAAART